MARKEFTGNILIAMPNTENVIGFIDALSTDIKNSKRIRVGKIDVVNTQEEIDKQIQKGGYDVLICLEELDVSIGKGSIEKWRKINEYMRIVMLVSSKKKGGKKLMSLFDIGYYNAIFDYPEDLTSENIVEMIVNGRSKEDAALYYGILDNSADDSSFENDLKDVKEKEEHINPVITDEIYDKTSFDNNEIDLEKNERKDMENNLDEELEKEKALFFYQSKNQNTTNGYKDKQQSISSKKSERVFEVRPEGERTKQDEIKSLCINGYKLRVATIINDTTCVLESENGGLNALKEGLEGKHVIMFES